MPLFADYEPKRRGETPPPTLSTRPATADDVPALAAIRAARDEMPVDAAAAIFRRQIATAAGGRALVLVAEVEGTVAGYGVADRLAMTGLPEGWYLGGVVVTPSMRRRGVGARLTRERLDWIAGRSSEAWYFVNERNRPSIDLHARFGFVEVQRGLKVPGITFTGGVGLLFRADLDKPAGISSARESERQR